MVTECDIFHSEKITNKKRKLEHLAARAALRTAIPRGTVKYDTAGAPYIESIQTPDGTLHISISHTDSAAAVAISPERCAVDIENCRRDFSRSRDRYVAAEEKTIADLLNDGYPPADKTGRKDICGGYGILWCAKEALYKYSGENGLDLIKDIRIEEAVSREGHTEGILSLSGRIKNNGAVQIKIIPEGGHIIALI